jgi:hypothetical protein
MSDNMNIVVRSHAQFFQLHDFNCGACPPQRTHGFSCHGCHGSHGCHLLFFTTSSSLHFYYTPLIYQEIKKMRPGGCHACSCRIQWNRIFRWRNRDERRVKFNHNAHQVALNDFTKCHSTAAGGKIEGFGKDIPARTAMPQVKSLPPARIAINRGKSRGENAPKLLISSSTGRHGY